MKYFIVADVHGFYNEMMEALTDAGFDKENPEHIFVSLGDMLDRGRQPLDCIRFVRSLPKNRRILIRGNHEDLMVSVLNTQSCYSHDISNGTYQTLQDIYRRLNPEVKTPYVFEVLDFCYHYKPLWEYLETTMDYAEVGDNIFVHGWIPADEDWRNATRDEWVKSRWVNGMKEWHLGTKEDGKTIYCGHWHTSFAHHTFENNGSEFGEDAVFTPFEADGICALDACTALSKFVNCKVIEV